MVGKGRVWLSCVVYPGRQEENEVLENGYEKPAILPSIVDGGGDFEI